MGGLALRIVKWSAFVVMFVIASSPRTHSVPDPSYLCIEQICYRTSPTETPDGPNKSQPARVLEQERSGELGSPTYS